MINENHIMPDWIILNLKMNTNNKTILKYKEVKFIDIPSSFFKPDANALSQFMKWAGSKK